MELHEARKNLRRMTKEDLLELASKQEITKCVVGGEECNLYFRYEGFGFCVSEILGQGCQVQRSKALENCYKVPKETDPPPSVEARDEERDMVGNTFLQYLSYPGSSQRRQVFLLVTKEPWKKKEPDASYRG